VLWGYPITWFITFVLFAVILIRFDWAHYHDRKTAKAA